MRQNNQEEKLCVRFFDMDYFNADYTRDLHNDSFEETFENLGEALKKIRDFENYG